MRIYKSSDTKGVSIVGFGLTLNVWEGQVTVAYDGATATLDDALRNGRLSDDSHGVPLTPEQLAWLELSKSWVRCQIEDER
jgi:hypothetical protein